MKKLIKKLEDIMVAITFAEAGEYDEANRQAGNGVQKEMSKTLDAFKPTVVEDARK